MADYPEPISFNGGPGEMPYDDEWLDGYRSDRWQDPFCACGRQARCSEAGYDAQGCYYSRAWCDACAEKVSA